MILLFDITRQDQKSLSSLETIFHNKGKIKHRLFNKRHNGHGPKCLFTFDLLENHYC